MLIIAPYWNWNGQNS